MGIPESWRTGSSCSLLPPALLPVQTVPRSTTMLFLEEGRAVVWKDIGFGVSQTWVEVQFFFSLAARRELVVLSFCTSVSSCINEKNISAT